MSNIAVAVTADVTDFGTKMALAQSNVRGLGSSVRQAANDIRDAGAAATAEMRGELEKYVAQLAAAQAQVAGLKAQQSAAAESTLSFTGAVKAANEQFETLIGFGRLFVAGAIAEQFRSAAERLGELVTHAGELGEGFEHLAQQTGLSVQQVQVLNYAANLSGVTFDTLQRLLSRFAGTLQDSLESPSDKAARALRALGIDATTVRSQSNDLAGMLTLVAQRLDRFGDGSHKSAIETAIFGQKIGGELIPFLSRLAGGMDQATSAAQEAGVVMGDQTVSALASGAEAVRKFDAQWEILKARLATTFMPGVVRGLELLNNILAATAPNIDADKERLEKMKKEADDLVGTIAKLRDQVKNPDPTSAVDPEMQLNVAVQRRAELLQQISELEQKISYYVGEQVETEKKSKPQAPNIGGTDTTARDLALARDMQREMNQEVQEAIRLANEHMAVDAAYYSRLEADARLAAAQGKISSRQEYDQLIELENEKFAAADRQVRAKLLLYGEDEAGYQQLVAEQQVATQQHFARLDSLQEQFIRQTDKDAHQMSKSWQDALNIIEGAERSLVSSVFSGRQSLSQSLIQLAGRTVESEIVADLKYLTVKAANSLFELGIDEKTASGGLLVHRLTEQRKSAATLQGTTIRTSAQATESTSFLGRLGATLAGWLGLETTKTAETVSGTATRTAAEIAASAAGRAAAVTAGFGQISIDAAVAAAGAMAAISAIPFVGPALAPEVAAATYAETLGWAAGMGGGIAGFAEGTDYVPRDGLAYLHEGEAVVPASQNLGSGNNVGVTFNVSAMDGASVMRVLNNNRSTLMSVIRTAVRNGTPLPAGFR